MNDCNFGKKTILYLYEELSDKERIKLKRHLEKCPNCRLEMEGLRETVGTFRELEILGPSPSCEAAVRRLAREKLTPRNSWLNRVKSFPERFVFRMPRPVTAGLGLFILLLALTLYISHQKAPFPFRENGPGEIARWENGVEDSLELLAGEVERIKEGEDLLSLLIVEEKIFFDEAVIDLQDEIKMVKWAMQVNEGSVLDEEMVNLEKDIFYLSSELNSI